MLWPFRQTVRFRTLTVLQTDNPSNGCKKYGLSFRTIHFDKVSEIMAILIVLLFCEIYGITFALLNVVRKKGIIKR